MSSQTVVLKVRMSCQGCAGAVNRVLEKMEGVESFNIDLKEQKVTVKGNVKPEDVLETVSKSGKKTAFWEDEAPAATQAAETQKQPSETATPDLENKPSETAAVVSDEPENKPAVETATLASAEPEIKPSETATTVA
ncbi:copper transport protein ATX1-like [Lotus japonicus]|uniref:HMA domain-containing protein n=1 Tax=Lotus japonicus TaxID=34305 RepID=I3SU18_LOTJA|nr:copper transport protein ATX1-like [Lotus japonicus]AFK43760.1 unknown [Lotus japonicus]